MAQAGIFINYRRSDTRGYALHMRDDLVEWFGQSRVFMDIGILGGQDWIVAIEQAISSSGVLLALIGPTWLQSRLKDPDDKLRQEILAAFELGVQVIPVLVGGAGMPDDEELPGPLRPLTRLQAVRLTDEGWSDDVRRLIRRLEQIVGPGLVQPRTQPTPPAPPSPSRVVRILVTVVLLAIFGAVGFLILQALGDGPPDGFDARIEVSPKSGPPGTDVTVTGTGFPPREEVDIRFQAQIVAELPADEEGGFTATFTIPDTPFTGPTDVMANSGAFFDSTSFDVEG